MILQKLPFVFILTLGGLVISCSSNDEADRSSASIPIDYRHIGDSLSVISTQTLLKNVAKEMQNGGPTNAVDFCNIHASEITDSLSQAYNATISRIAERNRNQNNLATEEEALLLTAMFNNKQQDTLIMDGDKPVYYKNILLGMPTCLKCHGGDTDISDSTRAIINERYPNDLATGFKLGDLRGAWKITFDQAD